MARALYPLGRFCARHARLTVAAWVVHAAPQGEKLSRGFGTGYTGPQLIAVDFGDTPGHPRANRWSPDWLGLVVPHLGVI